jgi:hypothetical protein
LLLITLLLVLLAGHSPREAVLGVLVVLAGVPVYWIFGRNMTIHQSPAELNATEMAKGA